MSNLKIIGDNGFSLLSEAFEGEVDSDCTLSAEVVTVSEEEIKRLNIQFRGIDAVTDVLSFPSLDGIYKKKILKTEHLQDLDEDGNLFIGSIAICEKRAKEQAEEYGHSEEREMYYLATHGVCHLLGYDHINEEDKAEMRKAEERALSKINLGRDGV